MRISEAELPHHWCLCRAWWRRRSPARALQHPLTHFFSGRALAVKRVTENKGKTTPGRRSDMENLGSESGGQLAQAQLVQDLAGFGITKVVELSRLQLS